jgi:hypothetical protein
MQDDDSFDVWRVLRDNLIFLGLIVAISLVVIALDRAIQLVVPCTTPWWCMAFLDGLLGAGLAFELGRWSRRRLP